MLFMSFVSSMDRVSLSQLLIDKSCSHDFNFTAEVCDNILNKTYEHEKSQIENEVAQFKVKYYFILPSCIVNTIWLIF